MIARRIFLAGLLAAGGGASQATTLNEAIEAALAHAPEIKVAQAESDTASAHVREAEGARLPSATVSGTIGVGRLDPQGFFGLGAANVTPRAAQVTIEQPLYAGGRMSAGIEQARAGVDAAQAGEDATRSQMMVAVSQAYGDVLTSRRLLAVNGQLASQMEEMLRQAKLRFEAGESPATDVAQAAARLAEAQAGFAQAQGQFVAADARFSSLTGLSPEGLEPLPSNPDLPQTLDEAIDRALQHNAMLAQAAADVSAANAGARGARAERLPTVGAFAEGALVRDQFFPDYRSDNATIGVRARWQIFSGATSAKISASESAARAAEARRDVLHNRVKEQVIAAFQDVRTALLVEGASARQVEAALTARDSVAHEVRVGVKPQLDLLNAEREYASAAAASVRAQGARIVAAYRLLALIGE